VTGDLPDAKIKELQMDQGGEFVSGAFRQFCSDAGILMRFATRKRSQQNGVAERSILLPCCLSLAFLHCSRAKL